MSITREDLLKVLDCKEEEMLEGMDPLLADRLIQLNSFKAEHYKEILTNEENIYGNYEELSRAGLDVITLQTTYKSNKWKGVPTEEVHILLFRCYAFDPDNKTFSLFSDYVSNNMQGKGPYKVITATSRFRMFASLLIEMDKLGIVKMTKDNVNYVHPDNEHIKLEYKKIAPTTEMREMIQNYLTNKE